MTAGPSCQLRCVVGYVTSSLRMELILQETVPVPSGGDSRVTALQEIPYSQAGRM